VDRLNNSVVSLNQEEFYSCYQCGACTGICTAADVFENFNPRLTVRLESLNLLGQTKDLPLNNKIGFKIDPANCFQCYACASVCPRGISPADIIKHRREINKENGIDNHVGLLKENLRQYGQSIVPEVFGGAERFWGDSWLELQEGPKYREAPPVKRQIPDNALKEINFLLDNSSNMKLTYSPPRKMSRPDLRKVDKVTLFESCCGTSLYPGLSRSVKYILEKIGIKYTVLKEQSCCGGFAYYANDLSLTELVLIGARNQSLIENEGNICISICSTCFSAYSTVNGLLSDDHNLEQVNGLLSEINKHQYGQIVGAHIQELLFDNLDIVRECIKLKFPDVKVALHSGCHFRHFRKGAEHQTTMDRLIELTGVTVVDYPLRYACCGGGFEKSFIGQIEKVHTINSKKQRSITNAGADIVVLDCPGCEMTFDRNSAELEKIQPLNLGYMNMLELLALAMGADPYKVVGVQYHTAQNPLMEKLVRVNDSRTPVLLTTLNK
jgi:heterodisulfide reductase subunit B/heterodisulfide reductase subunit C